jgi:hypothetical protein
VYPETHSQYDEEQAILAYFDSAVPRANAATRHAAGEHMRFLDIGAWDPKCFSNTRALFERGWGGVMIEPSPTPLLALLAEYGSEQRVRVFQAAMNTEPLGYIVMHMTADSVSTSDEASHEKWKTQVKFIGDLLVRVITWPEINNLFGGFDFVNIDAEGISVDLFHAMLLSGQKPVCCCVEHDGRLSELAAAATAVGYRLVYSNGTNAVFTL